MTQTSAGDSVLAQFARGCGINPFRDAEQNAIYMPLFIYRCLSTGQRVQGFASEAVVEDHHVYEPVTCPVFRLIHHVNPTTGAVLGEQAELPAVKKTPTVKPGLGSAHDPI
jgi:hypothetical protein